MKYLSSLVTQGSGVLGNMVVERNGVIRNRNIPANPDTTLQQERRATLTTSSQRWSGVLTELQRAAWNTYAATLTRTDALGKTKKISGIAAYVGGNAALTLAGQAAVTAAPTLTGSVSLPAVTNVVVDDSANTIIFTFADAVSADLFINLSLSTGSVSLGVSSYNGPFRFSESAAGEGTTTMTFVAPAAMVAGEKWAWRLAPLDGEGRTGKAQSGLTLVVA